MTVNDLIEKLEEYEGEQVIKVAYYEDVAVKYFEIDDIYEMPDELVIEIRPERTVPAH